MRRHIAVFTNLGNGHVFPALGLCAELIQRGHRVTYATSDYYAPRIQEIGAEPVLYKGKDFEDMRISKYLPNAKLDDPRWWTLSASISYPWFLEDAILTLPQVEYFYAENPPDAVLYDRYALAGRILAKRLEAPSVQLSFVFAPYKNYLIREAGVFRTPEPMLEFSEKLDAFLQNYGIEERGNLWHREKLNIYFLPRAFQFESNWFDERSCFVGACLNRPYTPVWKNRSGGRKIVLVSGLSDGIDVNYFKTFIEALSATPYYVILSVGKNLSADALGPLPENFELNRDAYHLEMLPHAALTICQAGMGTVLESIYHGVPVIAIPPNPSNEEIAYRVGEMNLGYQLHREEVIPTVIREKVDAILQDALIQSEVKRMQKIFNASGGATLAADKVEEYLRDPEVVSS